MKRFRANRTGFRRELRFSANWRSSAAIGCAFAETAYVVRALSNIGPMQRQSALKGINRRVSMGFLFTLGSF
jgi:hypothetical protein